MKDKARKSIYAEEAYVLLEKDGVLADCHVCNPLVLPSSEHWEQKIKINNCFFEHFEATMVSFDQPVEFKNSHFKHCSFPFSYFLSGLAIEKCTFKSYVDFQAGGHNRTGSPIYLSMNVFHDFVNFFDSTYGGEITIVKNSFEKGTNILGKEVMIKFKTPPVIENNMGLMSIEGEKLESS